MVLGRTDGGELGESGVGQLTGCFLCLVGQSTGGAGDLFREGRLGCLSRFRCRRQLALGFGGGVAGLDKTADDCTSGHDANSPWATQRAY